MSAAAWWPGATRKEIPPGANDPAGLPVMVVIHRTAVRAESQHDWFAHGSGGIESHGHTARDGYSEQYRDFFHEADAQSDGNSWIVDGRRLIAISWETEGTGDDIWTPAQVKELGGLLTFIRDNHGIPLVVVNEPHPTSAKDGGVGWHSKYPSWNPSSHNCPGDANVATLKRMLPHLASAPSLPAVSLADMKDSYARDRHRVKGLHPVQTRRVQRALGFKVLTGRWGLRTRAAFQHGPTQKSLTALGEHRFRVVE